MARYAGSLSKPQYISNLVCSQCQKSNFFKSMIKSRPGARQSFEGELTGLNGNYENMKHFCANVDETDKGRLYVYMKLQMLHG